MHLHLISFDIPYPANYGGVIDVFYKIRALKEAGASITLHCFEYGRPHADELKKYCTEVLYYKRKTGLLKNISTLPYIVNSRINKDLEERLLQDKHPIIIEGIHCSGILLNLNKAFKGRSILLRSHNIEQYYYKCLAKSSSSLVKKLYYTLESYRLRKYEQKLPSFLKIAAISKADTQWWSNLGLNATTIGPFHSNEEVSSKTGKGEYALFHGNLSVEENQEALSFLLNEVFSIVEIPFVIASDFMPEKLKTIVDAYPHISWHKQLDQHSLSKLMINAHVHVLPTFQPTGIKLKLINALYQGRFCLVTPQMVDNIGLEQLCTIAETSEEYRAELQNLFDLEFLPEEIEKRKVMLGENFRNEHNVENLLKTLDNKT